MILIANVQQLTWKILLFGHTCVCACACAYKYVDVACTLFVT